MKQILWTLFDVGALLGCGLILPEVWARMEWFSALPLTMLTISVMLRIIRERLEAWHKYSVYGE